ncbi:MAG TPA: ABC transporter ATP-binding protein [Thermoanaerobacterales bacterium]|nr:ABC transporter ATP-binding protein [Thermoanaerobacterales bacterium]
MSVNISIENVVKKYGSNTVIHNLTLNISDGELFTLLGPSGCGKTTLLRMIAGFNSIEEGTIKFDDRVINDIPANKRNIGMVFQNYAVFPHMTVKENVEYGLKVRKLSKSEIDKRVNEMLKLVKMQEFKDRFPEMLSGGQQQRVALARAIVIRPDVLLMDEPLSNLDAKLRIEMRSAIRDIQKEVGITTVYVTHDQEEALAISDRIAVIKEGTVQQVDRPYNIYARPENVFVATFIGHSNLFNGNILLKGDKKLIQFSSGYKIELNNLPPDVSEGQRVIVGVRPEEFIPADDGLKAKIKKRVFLGRYIEYELLFPEGIALPNQPTLKFSQDVGKTNIIFNEGDVICLKVNEEKINIFTENGMHNLVKDVMPV